MRNCTLPESANFEPLFYGGTMMVVLAVAVRFVDVRTITRTVFGPGVAYV